MTSTVAFIARQSVCENTVEGAPRKADFPAGIRYNHASVYLPDDLKSGICAGCSVS
jgi:hypothetical protein